MTPRRRPRRPGGGAVARRDATRIGRATAAEAEYRAILLGLETWHPRAENGAADELVRELLWGVETMRDGRPGR